ncbi:carboxypeptidase-like regulatory domain-containing protein [Chitinophaga sp. Cy-1792]|uniref:carboxypeptidase-like regulatory domain-containing protein n=1 Tax=Chitinophaga sp. Cy-1792 TaxID=2608339 RepID=UPI00141E8DD0|nr:carboxypeptidase-like regulatory domain-containing protein [Chitinophaga sp. Cy-1792]NIG56113.1 carboxypeptidase regulatory-like domain-containing protein [Chitinophaga sp. Cy-1792]
MSYLLIGNISALICDDCIEPLANARIRIYLPENNPREEHLTVVKGIFNQLRPLSAREVLSKADRLLAETTLDERGNFRLRWEQAHLFTEALELDLCLDQMPGKTGNLQSRNYHLSFMVPHWKKHMAGYVAAYAYVIPEDIWAEIYRSAGAWVVAGTVRHTTGVAQPGLRIAAFNALTGKKIAEVTSNPFGRYIMHFSRRDLYAGRLQLVKEGRRNMGPDIYFKIYKDEQLVWEEDEIHALAPDRQDIGPCARLDIVFKPGIIVRATRQIAIWLNAVKAFGEARKEKSKPLSATVHHKMVSGRAPLTEK